MRRTRVWALLMAALMLVFMAGCGGDGDDGATEATTTTEKEAEAPTEPATITAVEYGYEVEGSLATDKAVYTFDNTGKEVHMVELAKLKKGVTFDDARDGLLEAFKEDGGGEEGEEEGEESTTTSAASRSTTSTSSGSSSSTTGAGEEEEGDPFAEFFVDDEAEGKIGPGSVLSPGMKQTLSFGELDEGNYAIICFIPAPDGVPHAAKGMIGEIKVEGEADFDLPTPTQQVTLADKKTTVPAKLSAGETTFEVKNTGTEVHEFAAVELATPTSTAAAVDRYYDALFESEKKPVGTPPGEFAASVFEIPPGGSVVVTLTLKSGTYLIGCARSDDDAEPKVDHLIRPGELVRVTVT